MNSHLMFDLITDIWMLLQKQLCILTALADLIALVCIPGTALIHYGILNSKVKDIALLGNAGTKHDIKFCLLKWRSHLILHNLDPGVVTHHLSTLLQSLYTANIKTYRRVELQGTSTCGGLRITEHNSHFFTELIDKNHNTIRLTDDGSELTESLGHQTGLKTYMTVTHISVDFSLGYQCCNRVHNNNIHSAGYLTIVSAISSACSPLSGWEM